MVLRGCQSRSRIGRNMRGILLPSSTLGPSQSDNEVSVDTLIPIHGILAVVQVVGERSQITVVILDIVDATGATRDETIFGLRFSFCLRGGFGLRDRSSDGPHGQEAGQPSCKDLHVGWQKGKEGRMFQTLCAEWTCAEEDRVLNWSCRELLILTVGCLYISLRACYLPFSPVGRLAFRESAP